MPGLREEIHNKMIHELKIMPNHFKAVVAMTRPFEVRYENDRVFRLGDELLLKEWIPSGYYEPAEKECYSGEICHRTVTYRQELADNVVILGLARK